MARKNLPTGFDPIWACNLATWETPAHIFQIIESGRSVRWYIHHPDLPCPLCIEAGSPDRLSSQGIRAFSQAWDKIEGKLLRDLNAALVQQLTLSKAEAEDIVDAWNEDSTRYALDQLDARVAGLIE